MLSNWCHLLSVKLDVGKRKKIHICLANDQNQNTRMQTHKTTPLSQKPNHYCLKKIPQPIPKLIWNFILKLNLQQTYCFTGGREGKSSSSKHFQPEKKLLARKYSGNIQRQLKHMVINRLTRSLIYYFNFSAISGSTTLGKRR